MPQILHEDHSTGTKLREEIDSEVAVLQERVRTLCVESREGNEAEIAALQERIRLLHVERNNTAPISHLPPEILTRIFGYFQDSIIDAADVEEQAKYARWIVILQVIQSWRECALGSKELWSSIDIADSRWIENTYERSGTNDLSIKFDVSEVSLGLFRSAIRGPQRISSLKLVTGSSLWLEVLPLLKFPTQSLKVLELKPRLGYLGETVGVVPADLFGGECPELRSLCVESFDISLDTPLFQGVKLTSLAIKLPSNVICISDMLQYLQRLPQLRSLSLVEALTSEGVPHNFNPVYLPNLTFLELEDLGLENNTEFLRLITLPETTSLRVESFDLPLRPIERFGKVMDNITKTFPDFVLRDLNIGWQKYKISMDSPKVPGGRLSCGLAAMPFVRFEFQFERSLTNDYVTQWLLHLPISFLAPVEIFRLKSGQPLSAESWTALSRNLPNVQHLKIGQRTTSFVDHLSSLSSEISHHSHVDGQPLSASVKPDFIHSALRRLTLPINSVDEAITLQASLASRKQDGLELEQLYIRMADDPVLREQIVAILQGTVKEICWV